MRWMWLWWFWILFLTQGCASSSYSGQDAYNPLSELEDFTDVRHFVLKRPASLRPFFKNGPFRVDVERNRELNLSENEIVVLDIFLADHDEKSPLILIQHGNLADGSVHHYQAERLASWGLHAIVVSQPNYGRWLKNGQNLAKLVRLLHAWPEFVDHRFDPKKIIVSGHSFGGSATAIATSGEAPVAGAILLDPALVDNKVKTYIKKIKAPMIILGADRKVFLSRQRESFYKLKPKEVLEVSIKNSTHNDAQFPELFSLPQFIGYEHATQEKRQNTFAAAITVAAFSLTLTNSYQYAWHAYRKEIKRGVIYHSRLK